jgi:hypothetical protein
VAEAESTDTAPSRGSRILQGAATTLLFALAGLLWLRALPAHHPSKSRHGIRIPVKRRITLDTPILFRDRAAEAGLHYRWTISNQYQHNVLESIGNGCALFDYNNDGNLDILLVGPKLALYQGDGKGHFTDVTHQAGLDRLHGHFLGCAVGDYDNDGYDDLYISGYQTGLLLHNESGRSFRDVTREAGLGPQPFGTTCAFGSMDGSRYLDLFVCNYVRMIPLDWRSAADPRRYPPLSSLLFHNLDGRHFVDVTEAWGTKTLSGRGLGAAFAPIDAQYHMGLAVANDMGLSDLFTLTAPGKLMNVGERSGVASPPALKGLNGRMGIDWGDYDNDGLLDLFITTFQREPKILLHNQGDGLFEDSGPPISKDDVLDTLAFGCKWLDADNSGWLDLLVSNGHLDNTGNFRGPFVAYRQRTLLLANTHGRGLANAGESAGMGALPPIVGRGLATGDFDNDGRVDALVVDSEGSPLLLHNESSPAGHWLSLKLIGTRCNADGYGAIVTVQAGAMAQTRLCHSDGSYLSASDRRVHIGLGSATVIDSLTVRWPDGHIDAYRQVPADHIRTCREGDPDLH